MEPGKKPGKLLSSANSILYMDLKDIIREHALPFLPAISLLRFRAVCRDWKLHISAPFFHHTQSLCCRAISGLFCQTPENPPVFIPIHLNCSGVPDPSLSFLPEPVDLKASSNGLLCCQGRSGNKPYYMCNPATKQWHKLPEPTACHGPDSALVVAFEPSLLNFVPEYKLICAFRSADFDDAAEFEIYTSRNNSWSVSGEIRFGVKRFTPRSGIHVNGVVYWNMAGGGILSFDLAKDRSQLLEKHYYSNDCALGTFDGKLCKTSLRGLSVCISALVNVHTNTMEMNSITKMWEPVQNVSLQSNVLDGDHNRCKIEILSSDVLVIKCGRKLYSYDFKSKETKALNQPGAETYDATICVPYVNSLASL
ncbi:unnamed protein product [Cuscuta epithymum]|uniref:F-box protein At3g26010-like beta-propeller domain-containing protein n=1 Tax=Cuscuta epithymum TaxID=186058 RepID=A0AAV0FA93_9ASTE|nr:unnamed protein product [Cuscuta epithymum]CAH9132406.1 unnamed protein product [Cuscuta epithymum]